MSCAYAGVRLAIYAAHGWGGWLAFILTEPSVRQALAVELQRAEVWVLIVVRVTDWV